jgi:enamine deaminase RidA (YjgF/YER057c/UK114 family)
MRKRLEHWLGKQFVYLSAESTTGLAPAEGLRQLYGQFDQELAAVGLSLDNTVRTRLWARDRAGRDAGSKVRTEVLSGKRRSASSSYFSPSHFSGEGTVALDLVALRPSNSAEEKMLREYEPRAVPLRYLVWDTVVVLSGVTAPEPPTLATQLDDILPRINASLQDAGVGWEQVVNVDWFVHRSLTRDEVEEQMRRVIPASVPRRGYELVDGYSAPGKFVEMEVTALR